MPPPPSGITANRLETVQRDHFEFKNNKKKNSSVYKTLKACHATYFGPRIGPGHCCRRKVRKLYAMGRQCTPQPGDSDTIVEFILQKRSKSYITLILIFFFVLYMFRYRDSELRAFACIAFFIVKYMHIFAYFYRFSSKMLIFQFFWLHILTNVSNFE